MKSLVSRKRLIASGYLTYVAYIETLNNMVTFGWKYITKSKTKNIMGKVQCCFDAKRMWIHLK
jgi:hypothetical protein